MHFPWLQPTLREVSCKSVRLWPFVLNMCWLLSFSIAITKLRILQTWELSRRQKKKTKRLALLCDCVNTWLGLWSGIMRLHISIPQNLYCCCFGWHFSILWIQADSFLTFCHKCPNITYLQLNICFNKVYECIVNGKLFTKKREKHSGQNMKS